MNRRLEIRAKAVSDIEDAASWYEHHQGGLGERFTREVIQAIDSLISNPLKYRLRSRRLGARWCYPQNFPYRIVYKVTNETVIVVAVIHAARRDRLWKERF